MADLTGLLCEVSRSHISHRVLLSNNANHIHRLVKNEELAEDVWVKAYELSFAEGCSSSFSDDLFNKGIAPWQAPYLLTEDRESVRKAAFRNGLVGITAQDAKRVIASAQFTEVDAIRWLESRRAPSVVVRDLLRITDGDGVVNNLWRKDIFSDDEVVESLKSLTSFFYDEEIYRILDYRPEILKPLIMTYNSKYLEAIAGCRHLFDPEVIDEVFLHARACWHVREIGRSERDFAKSISILATNPNLSAGQRDKIANAMRRAVKYGKLGSYCQDKLYNGAVTRLAYPDGVRKNTKDWAQATGKSRANIIRVATVLGAEKRYPTLGEEFFSSESPEEDKTNPWPSSVSPEYVNEQIVPKVDALGESGWRVFLGAVPYWQQSVNDLLRVLPELVV